MADDSLRLLRARLDAFAQRADADAVLDAGAVADAGAALAATAGRGDEAEAEAVRMAALLYWHRYCLTADGDTDDLDAAVRLFTRVFRLDPDSVPKPLLPLVEEAEEPAEDDDDEPVTWDRMAQPFLERYRADGRPQDLRRAIGLLTAAWDAVPDSAHEQAVVFGQLFGALLDLHTDTGDVAALDVVVDRARATLADAATPAVVRPLAWTALMRGLWAKAQRSGEVAQLLEAVEAGRRALELIPSEHTARAAYLSNLGAALQDLYQYTGDSADLDDSLSLLRSAVATTEQGDPGLATRSGNLSITLRAVFLRSGDLALLREAAEAGRQALELIPLDHPLRASYLSNLGTVLQDLYQRTGNLSHLDESLHLLRAAVESAPLTHPAHSEFLGRLGAGQWLLYRATGDGDSLRQAVNLGRAAVATIPADHPDRPRFLGNLAAGLRARFDQTGDPELLDEVVALSRAAVGVTPVGYPDLAVRLNNLGNALRTRYERAGDQDSLSDAVAVGRASVAATPVDHPDRPRFLSNLATSLRAWYDRADDLELLDEAIVLSRAAVDATPADHPDLAIRLTNFANALLALFNRSGRETVRHEAKEALRAAAAITAAPAHVRMQAAWSLAEAAAADGAVEEAVEGYASAVSLLPQVAPPRLTRQDREERLGRLAGLGADAAASALAAGRPELAVELLEQARGHLLSEALSIRDDFGGLRAHSPALFERYQRLRKLLDGSTDVDQTARLRAANDWERLLSEIRMLPGFEAFLRTPSIADLLAVASEGPIVVLNASRFRCDALILDRASGTSVRVVPLDTVDLALLVQKANVLLHALRRADDFQPGSRASAQLDLLDVMAWLWDAVVHPVFEAMGITEAPAIGQAWPIVWWCPVGPFAYFPLHAAGRHDADQACDSALDRVMSSYTPTVRALVHGRRRGPSGGSSGGSSGGREPSAAAPLIVAVPRTPGAPPLPATLDEARAFKELFPGAHTLIGPEADRAAVMAALQESTIAHFACHGMIDWRDAARSSLLLHDQPLTAADIAAAGPLDQVELVMLSACSTAVSTVRMTDEALHLSTAFIAAGAPHVVATLWAVDDRSAAQAASDFYQLLGSTADGAPDAERAIAALHETTRVLRDRYPGRPGMWAPFIHLGR